MSHSILFRLLGSYILQTKKCNLPQKKFQKIFVSFKKVLTFALVKRSDKRAADNTKDCLVV